MAHTKMAAGLAASASPRPRKTPDAATSPSTDCFSIRSKTRVIDYVGGRDDLAARKVRAIGSPAERFAEDHLRLLRAVRFAARFGFEIEPATAEAIRSLASRVKGISPERIGDELRLMLTPPDPQRRLEVALGFAPGGRDFSISSENAPIASMNPARFFSTWQLANRFRSACAWRRRRSACGCRENRT